METLDGARFDPYFTAQLLLDIANEQSLDRLLHRLLDLGVEQPGIVGIQFWLIEQGDRCTKCPRQSECADQSRCLHLVVAKARPAAGLRKGLSRLESLDTRVPLEGTQLGNAVLSGQEKIILNLEKEPASIDVPDWIREQGVRVCIVTPISFKGEALGAFAVFRQDGLPEESRPWGPVFANQVGAAVAITRAFQEIQHLKAQLELQNTYLQEEVVEARAFGDLVGRSAPLRHIVSQIDLVAATEASVLILGETGTGKELVAHEIHRRSPRSAGPLVRVNCASIPRNLFESEFFGHVKGAFTGAIKDRAGRFETADGGTIFLDEVGEIPLETQSKLLRVLQERRYERVGEDRTRQADVRVVAATNQDLKKAMESGRFREDLYYRLNVFPISVPPLRDRMDDIPLLAKHFLDLSARELKCGKPRLTKAAVAKLEGYHWPGNIREFRNVMERSLILARGGAIDFDLPVTTRPARPRSVLPTQSPDGNPRQPRFFTEAELQRQGRENLLLILETAKWRIKGPEGAAELLGIKPSTMITRMRKWGLKRPRPAVS